MFDLVYLSLVLSSALILGRFVWDVPYRPAHNHEGDDEELL